VRARERDREREEEEEEEGREKRMITSPRLMGVFSQELDE